MNKVILGLTTALLLTGCYTVPSQFIESSAPVPDTGYKVIGEEVCGTSKQVWFLGFGGSTTPRQSAALRDAMSAAPKGTDALVSVSIERHRFSMIIYASEKTSVSGIPVKFNR